jgi:hypothetical protein
MLVEMTAKEKLEEAKFFLQKLSPSQSTLQETVYYYSAFLSSARSIFDHLLEEANQKFVLGIPLDQRLDGKKFNELTRYSGNIRAREFIQWYDSVFDKINKTEIGKIFKIERDLNTHRRIQTPQLVCKITVMDDPHKSKKTFILDVEPTAENMDNSINATVANITEVINTERKKAGQPESNHFSFSIYFSINDDHEKDLVQSCTTFVNVLQELIISPSESLLKTTIR